MNAYEELARERKALRNALIVWAVADDGDREDTDLAEHLRDLNPAAFAVRVSPATWDRTCDLVEALGRAHRREGEARIEDALHAKEMQL